MHKFISRLYSPDKEKDIMTQATKELTKQSIKNVSHVTTF
uniref:Uncharacterized protein n=1 Tax=Rhizophora mucronata TaxID=61149 RepID=A0A2P2PUT7_RHIMU